MWYNKWQYQSQKVMKRTLFLIIVGAVWALSLGWLTHRPGGCDRRPLNPAAPDSSSLEAWHGIYLSGQKAGYSSTLSRPDGSGGRLVRNRVYLEISMMNSPQRVVTATDYRMDGNYRLQELSFTMEGAARISLKGKVKKNRLELEIASGGQIQSQAVALDGPVFLPDAIEPMIANRTLRPGDRYSYSTFDPASLSLQPAVITVQGPESLDLQGRMVPATRLELALGSTSSTVWVDSAGQAVKEQGPLGITLIREERETALRMPQGGSGVDLLAQFSVPVSGPPMADPRNISYLKLKLSGLDPSGLDLSGGRQELQEEWVVSVSREGEEMGTGPVPDSLKVYLKPTALIQSEDPRIARLAREITAGQSGCWNRAVAISRWVNQSLEKQMTVSLPSAVEVLESRRGDCNEHATLFAALARAAGIPARLCLGVVYLDGRFYYHAWNAVYCGQWVELDPTFGQEPADAARLRLLEGDLSQQGRLLPVLGNLKIEILEHR